MSRHAAQERAAIARARETHWLRRDDERAAQYLRERTRAAMNTRKTPLGDQVPKAASSDPLRQELDDLYELATEVFDETAAAAQREAAIANVNTVDSKRFPIFQEN